MILFEWRRVVPDRIFGPSLMDDKEVSDYIIFFDKNTRNLHGHFRRRKFRSNEAIRTENRSAFLWFIMSEI